MKKFIATAASAALVIASSMALTASPAVAQQYTGRVVCVAESPSAYGYSTSVFKDEACRNALYQCAIRTPENEWCVITGWYRETR